jgi:hypothetical protein
MHIKKIPAQFWLLLLLASWFYLPLYSIFPIDSKIDWLIATLLLQWAVVIACYILSGSRWCAAVIIIEIFCMAYNIAACYAPEALRDTFYNGRPIVVQIAFILQLLAIAISTGGGVGSHNIYNRRKSDTTDNPDSDLNSSQHILGCESVLEASK